MSRIIAFTGYAGSGKSTAAQHLVERHGYTLVKFAAPLKAMMRALGLGEREIEGDLKEMPSPLLCGRTPRHAMQTLGTEWGRDLIHPSLWVTVAAASIDAVIAQGGDVVVDDLRFVNEAEVIRNRGGYIVEMYRQGYGPINAHASEHHDLIFDSIICNYATPGALGDSVDIALQDMEPCA